MVAYSFKPRFVEPIRAGLSLPNFNQFGVDRNGLDILPKRQTIRPVGKRRHARPGDTLQLYTGMRTRQCRKIGDARCTEVLSIRIDVAENGLAIGEVASKAVLKAGTAILDDFARNDGFADAADMHRFWMKEHGIGFFKMVLIKWEPLNG